MDVLLTLANKNIRIPHRSRFAPSTKIGPSTGPPVALLAHPASPRINPGTIRRREVLTLWTGTRLLSSLMHINRVHLNCIRSGIPQFRQKVGIVKIGISCKEVTRIGCQVIPMRHERVVYSNIRNADGGLGITDNCQKSETATLLADGLLELSLWKRSCERLDPISIHWGDATTRVVRITGTDKLCRFGKWKGESGICSWIIHV